MPLKIPIGLSDFRKLRESGSWYVDKTSFVAGILEASTEIYLFPHPQRFGKTLNLSTFRCFVEKPVEPWDATPLFEDLAVWRSQEARRHFQRYPTLSFSFKGVKARSWEDTWVGIRGEIGRVVKEHRYLLSGALPEDDTRDLSRLLDPDLDPAPARNALSLLSRLLHAHHGERVVILVDEYDVPMQAGWMGGFYEEVIDFFRTFLTEGLKDNPHLFKGVLTGVLRVAKESILSGLNNPEIWSILNEPFSRDFGFTEDEVGALCLALGRPETMEEVRRWYDGYSFAGTRIYNPWSVLNFALEPDPGGRPFWVHTSSNDLLRRLLLERGHTVAGDIETLMAGGTLTREVDDNIVFTDLDRSSTAAMSLLVMSGYLTARVIRNERGRMMCDLAVPNLEVHSLFETIIRNWLEMSTPRADRPQVMLQAMLEGDDETFADLLSEMVTRTFSYHDVGSDDPERVYHAFLLGLMMYLPPTHEVRSNRESGYGRCDVMVIPKVPGGTGVVLELKRLRPARETVESALASALAQVKDRKYADEVRSRGAGIVREYGIVFDGKKVVVGVEVGVR